METMLMVLVPELPSENIFFEINEAYEIPAIAPKSIWFVMSSKNQFWTKVNTTKIKLNVKVIPIFAKMFSLEVGNRKLIIANTMIPYPIMNIKNIMAIEIIIPNICLTLDIHSLVFNPY